MNSLQIHIDIGLFIYYKKYENIKNNEQKQLTAYMVSQILLQKSSANYLARVEFSQKGFVDLDFGHHQCPFLEIFLTLVQIRIEK